MSQTENSFTFREVQQTIKVANIYQFIQNEGEFPSELHKTYDVLSFKMHKRMLPKGFL